MLLLMGTLAGLLLDEAYLRIWNPQTRMIGGNQLWWIAGNPDYRSTRFTIDPDFGFRPILGNDLYNRYGTLLNDYPVDRRPGVERLLFVGDSVTFRGLLLQAIRKEFGELRYEYWNAGVDSFNTLQEIQFYSRFNAALHPGHVIMTMHNNDLGSTPVAFVDEQQRFIVYAPGRPQHRLYRWLFSWSHLYRLLLNMQLKTESEDQAASEKETREELRAFSRDLGNNGIRFSVIILPILRPLAGWRPFEKRNYRTSLLLLQELGIRYFDLLPAMEKALADNVEIDQDRGYAWHPTSQVSAYFAKYLSEQRLLP